MSTSDPRAAAARAALMVDDGQWRALPGSATCRAKECAAFHERCPSPFANRPASECGCLRMLCAADAVGEPSEVPGQFEVQDLIGDIVEYAMRGATPYRERVRQAVNDLFDIVHRTARAVEKATRDQYEPTRAAQAQEVARLKDELIEANTQGLELAAHLADSMRESAALRQQLDMLQQDYEALDAANRLREGLNERYRQQLAESHKRIGALTQPDYGEPHETIINRVHEACTSFDGSDQGPTCTDLCSILGWMLAAEDRATQAERQLAEAREAALDAAAKVSEAFDPLTGAGGAIAAALRALGGTQG